MSEVKRYTAGEIHDMVLRARRIPPLSNPSPSEFYAAEDYDALAAENERLRKALRRHGTHLGNCPHNLAHPDCDFGEACNCGLAALAKELTT